MQQGYLHWLNKQDGHFRRPTTHIGSARFMHAPLVVENNILYALTSSGYLAAYVL